MTNREKLMSLAARLPEELAGEVLDFAEFLAAKRGQALSTDWEAACEEEDVTPELAKRLDAADAEPGEVPAEDVYRQAGLL